MVTPGCCGAAKGHVPFGKLLLLGVVTVCACFIGGALAGRSAVKSRGDGDIVLVGPPASPLHPLLSLAGELDRRGQKVTVLSMKGGLKKAERYGVAHLYEEIGDYGVDELSDKIEKTLNNPGVSFTASFRELAPMLAKMSAALSDGFASYIQRRLGAGRGVPSLAVVAMMSNGVMRKCDQHGIPFIISHPTVAIAPVFSALPYVPVIFTGVPLTGKTFIQRTFNAALHTVFGLVLPLVGYPVEFLDPSAFSGRPRLIHSFPGLDYPRHASPLDMYTGPMVTRGQADPSKIDEKDRAWIAEGGGRTLVYVSMGSVMELDVQTASSFIQGYARLSVGPQGCEGLAEGTVALKETEKGPRFFWALSGRQQKRLGLSTAESPDEGAISLSESDIQCAKNLADRGDLRIVGWGATPSMLALPETALFLTHCGGNGVHEAVFARTPMVGVPFAGDQQEVCARAERAGVMRYVYRGDLTTDTLEKTLRSVLTGSENIGKPGGGVVSEPYLGFVEAVDRLERLSRLYGGVSTAADIVETFLETGNEGARLLAPPTEKIGVNRLEMLWCWVSAFCVDVILALIVCAFAFGCCLGKGKCSRRRGVKVQKGEESEETKKTK
mmetsp:Transcript_16212/g.32831  ORF Transcript_16212/g.32831 Transcript_16212/m.32831 type:complete len:610 (-) Transcript_16212:68-1897(-)